jgi:hypothetical protein
VFNRSPYRDKKVVSVFVRFRAEVTNPRRLCMLPNAPKNGRNLYHQVREIHFELQHRINFQYRAFVGNCKTCFLILTCIIITNVFQLVHVRFHGIC